MIRKIYQNTVLALCVILSLGNLSHGDEGYHSEKRILDNGLTVLMSPMPASPVVSVYALVKTGSATEGQYLGTGISHFLEHMLFKGTHGRGVGEIAAKIQSVGGEINAATSRDYTIYTITVPYDRFDVALAILSDMLMRATIDEQEAEREREVILGEMRLRNDDPDRVIDELVYQNLYLRHPYRHPIIGYAPLFTKVTAEELATYYRERYVPNNTILSIAGRFDSSSALKKITQAFKDFERGRPVVRNLPVEPAQINPRTYKQEYPTDLTRLSMSYLSVSLLNPDLYALDVLANVLGQGKSSRLFVNVYKAKGLVHNIYAYNHTPIDKGMFAVECLLEDANVDATIKEVQSHVKAIKASGVKPQELAKAKKQVESYFIFSHQTSASVAYVQAVDEAYTGDPEFSRKYVKEIGKVTNKDIQRVAKKYLVDSALTTVVLRPEQKAPAAVTKNEPLSEVPIQKHVLNNGMTILLKRDATFPVVSVRVNFNGGVRQEDPLLNGLSELTASTWIRGTKRYSANEIAEITDSLGMKLTSFSGRNSLGLHLKFLSDQLPEAFDLLEELVLHPVFPTEDMKEIKGNMKAAVRVRDFDIFDNTARALRQTLFLTHPFRLDQGGTAKTLDAIEQEDLADFYDQLAVSRNMVVSVFGDIEPDEVLKDLKQMFAPVKGRDAKLQIHSEPPPEKPRVKKLTMDKQQAMVMLGFQGPPIDDADRYGLEVTTSILGSSFSGRLFNTIREKMGGAYTLGGQYIPGPDMGFIYFYALTSEEKADRVRGLIENEIRLLQTEAPGAAELKDMKTFLKGTFRSSLETVSALSFTADLDELYGLGFNHFRKYDGLIDAVTAGDVSRLAREYLDLNKAAVVITKPEMKSDR